MNKSEMIQEVQKIGLSSREASAAVDEVIFIIGRELIKGKSVTLMNLGKFSVNTFRSRKGVNPRTGKDIVIAERKMPVFKSSKKLRSLVQTQK